MELLLTDPPESPFWPGRQYTNLQVWLQARGKVSGRQRIIAFV